MFFSSENLNSFSNCISWWWWWNDEMRNSLDLTKVINAQIRAEQWALENPTSIIPMKLTFKSCPALHFHFINAGWWTQLVFPLNSQNFSLAVYWKWSDKGDPTYEGLDSQGVNETVTEVKSDQLRQTAIKREHFTSSVNFTTTAAASPSKCSVLNRPDRIIGEVQLPVKWRN